MIFETPLFSSPVKTPPSALNLFGRPAEREVRSARWLSWPRQEGIGQKKGAGSLSEFVALCRGIVDLDPVLHTPRGDQLNILVADQRQLALAEDALRGLHARFYVEADGKAPC